MNLRMHPAQGYEDYQVAHQVREIVDHVAREHIGFSSLAGRFGLGDAEILRALMDGAGFAEVTVMPVELMLHLPSYTEFVRSTVAPDLAQLPTDEQETIARAVEEAVRSQIGDYLDGTALRCPTKTYIAAAQR